MEIEKEPDTNGNGNDENNNNNNDNNDNNNKETSTSESKMIEEEPIKQPAPQQSSKEKNKEDLKKKFALIFSRIQKGCNRDRCSSIACLVNSNNRDLIGSIVTQKQQRALKILKENLGDFYICSELENERFRGFQASNFAEEAQDFKPFLERVERIFTDFDALSTSFWSGTRTTDSVVSQKMSYLDLPALNAFYASTESCSKEQQEIFNEKIEVAIISILSPLDTEEKFRKQFDSKEAMRVLLIAFLYPPTLSSDNIAVFDRISHIFEFLSEEEIEMFGYWMMEVSKERIEKIIESQMNFIMISLLDESNEQNYGQIAAMKIMKIIYTSNLLSTRVSREIFIMSVFDQDIEECLSPIGVYKSWIRNKKNGGKKSGSLSFCDYPFCMDIKFKYMLLEIDSKVAQQQEHEKKIQNLISQGHLFVNASELHLTFEVSRNNILQDTLDAISKPGSNFKLPFKVKFSGEIGIDQGGLRKEYYQIMIKQLFNPDFGLFIEKQNKQYNWFNGNCIEMPILYELIGSLMGIAIFNQIQMDARFPNVIYKKLIGEVVSIEDINQFDSSTYKGLKHILEYEGDLENDLQQTFSVEYESFEQTFTYELIPGGDSIPVTQQNKKQYIDLYVDYILNKSIERQFNNFKRGFFKVLNNDVIKLFTFDELFLILTGKEELDIEELKNSTAYDAGYSETSEQIVWLWEIIHEFSIEQRKKFLFFCTGSDRSPVTGLKSLKFVIGKNGEDNVQLPSAHTCFNHLLIPAYSSKDILREKLLLSLENSEGFGLY